jgi:hypothetical protein
VINYTKSVLQPGRGENASARIESMLPPEPRLKRACDLHLKTDPIPGRQCGHCGSTNLLEGEAEVPHRVPYVCADCGQHAGFIFAPPSLKRARRFRLEFGRFKGQRLGGLTRTQQGQSYLRWLGREVRGNAGHAAELVLRGIKK